MDVDALLAEMDEAIAGCGDKGKRNNNQVYHTVTKPTKYDTEEKVNASQSSVTITRTSVIKPAVISPSATNNAAIATTNINSFNTISASKSPVRSSGKQDDLDALLSSLDDLVTETHSPKPYSTTATTTLTRPAVTSPTTTSASTPSTILATITKSSSSSSLHSVPTTNCLVPCLSSCSNCPAPPRACSRLLCTACAFTVLRIPDHRWSNSVDYLFFRNNMPNRAKLQPQLIACDKPDECAAYCCQCSWYNCESKSQSVSQTTCKWVCQGH